MSKHLCLSCRLAEWSKTETGRLRPSGDGRCKWVPPHIPTPAAWAWNFGKGQPKPSWGWINRRPSAPYTECETYEKSA